MRDLWSGEPAHLLGNSALATLTAAPITSVVLAFYTHSRPFVGITIGTFLMELGRSTMVAVFLISIAATICVVLPLAILSRWQRGGPGVVFVLANTPAALLGHDSSLLGFVGMLCLGTLFAGVFCSRAYDG